MAEIATFAQDTVERIAALDKEQLRPSGSSLPLSALRRRDRRDHPRNSRAYGCTSWKSREEPGCGFVIWKRVASRTLTRRSPAS